MEEEEKGSQVQSSVHSRGEREGEGYSMEVTASNVVEDLSALPVEAFESELSTGNSVLNSQIQRQGQLNGLSAAAAPSGQSTSVSSSVHHSMEMEGSEVMESEGLADGDQCKSGRKQRRTESRSASKHTE